jgi:hypothetical protein
MRPAPQLQVLDVADSSGREGDDMMKLEKARFETSADRPHVGATTLVALPDLALDLCRNVPTGYWRVVAG